LFYRYYPNWCKFCASTSQGWRRRVSSFHLRSVTCTESVTFWPGLCFLSWDLGLRSSLFVSTRSTWDGACATRTHALNGTRLILHLYCHACSRSGMCKLRPAGRKASRAAVTCVMNTHTKKKKIKLLQIKMQNGPYTLHSIEKMVCMVSIWHVVCHILLILALFIEKYSIILFWISFLW